MNVGRVGDIDSPRQSIGLSPLEFEYQNENKSQIHIEMYNLPLAFFTQLKLLILI